MAVTLKMIAEASGVSIRTVGRVLHGEGLVAPEVAAKVSRIARERGYIPNAAARSLRTRSSNIVGIIVGREDSCEAQRKCFDGMEKHLRTHGLHPLLGSLPESMEELQRLLNEWSGIVRTVIFTAWDPRWRAEKLRQLPMNVLFLDRTPPDPENFDVFMVDRSSGVTAAVQALADAGCRRIAHACSPRVSGRQEGFENAVSSVRGGVRFFRFQCTGSDMADGYGLGPQLCRNRIDGVFFDTDRAALGFYRYAAEHGIRIPEDLAVAGFDDDGACAYAIPALSSVAHPREDLIQAAVRRILNPGGPAVHQSFPSCFIARESI